LAALSVDPGWEGELLIILTNVGREPVKVEYKQRLMTLCLFWMSTPAVKKVDRARWNNNNVIEEFHRIEAAASKQEFRRRSWDISVVVLLAIVIVALRYKRFFETNVNSVMLWSSFTALYFSFLRKMLFRLLRL
jgi:hypothetical protein